MKIAIDMDNTLVDELGATVRPGIVDFLETLSKNHELVLWTNSTKSRAIQMLYVHGLREYFPRIIAREDYDPENQGLGKDLRKYDLEFLIDDDPEEISFNKTNKKSAILVESYRKGKKMRETELKEILDRLSVENRNSPFQLFSSKRS
jgi:TFIIF-interacting CTD phosphatase-like protein